MKIIRTITKDIHTLRSQHTTARNSVGSAVEAGVIDEGSFMQFTVRFTVLSERSSDLKRRRWSTPAINDQVVRRTHRGVVVRSRPWFFMFLFIGNSFSFVAIIWYTYCMSEVLQANIFFFITSVAVILFTLLLCIALYHVVKILKSIRRVMEKVEA